MVVLMFLIVLITSANQIFNKVFSREYAGNMPSMFLFGFLWSAGGAAAYAAVNLLSGGDFRYPPGTLVLALSGGMGFVFCNYFLYLALENGPVSVTMMFATAAVAVPCLAGPLVFGETVGLKSGIALAFLLLALFLVVYEKPQSAQKSSPRFLLFASLIFLLNGSVMFIQKYQPFRYPDIPLVQFSALLFALAAAVNLLMFGICRMRGGRMKPIIFRAFTVPCIVSGLCLCGANQLSMTVSRYIDAAVQYPVQSGGMLVVTTMISALLFREKTGLRKWIGVGMIVVAIVFL